MEAYCVRFLIKKLCAILCDVEKDCETWQLWAKTLQQWGIAGWAAALLEAAGPFSLVAAQAVYLGQPFLKYTISGDRLQALAHILEDPHQTQVFTRILRERSSA
jgi:hypothetical protein